MNRKFTAVMWLGLIGFAAGIGFFGWTIVTTNRLNTCIVCKRHVHAETRTIAEVAGLRTQLCCPTCAGILRDSGKKDARVVEVTDLTSGELIDARQAYVVVASDVNYCMQADSYLDEHKQSAPMMFDRCSPSMISFSELDEANRFSAEHGGEVVPGDYAFAFERKRESPGADSPR